MRKLWIIFAGMTIGELYGKILDCSLTVYDRREAESVARYIMRERFGVERLQLIVEPDIKVNGIEDIDLILSQVAAARPVQYIAGTTVFCDIELQVCEGVLIPRPETEELVEWIVGEANENTKVLDIGTGSGAIALALASRLQGAYVTATDISAEALEIARGNASKTGTTVHFLQNNILDKLQWNKTGGSFDIIVSNPPYIPEKELGTVHPNVREYEPHGALFVPDDDPLVFYRAIVDFSLEHLNPNGKLYFEVHENFAVQVAELLDGKGFLKVEVRTDIHGKKRMVRAIKVDGRKE